MTSTSSTSVASTVTNKLTSSFSNMTIPFSSNSYPVTSPVAVAATSSTTATASHQSNVNGNAREEPFDKSTVVVIACTGGVGLLIIIIAFIIVIVLLTRRSVSFTIVASKCKILRI